MRTLCLASDAHRRAGVVELASDLSLQICLIVRLSEHFSRIDSLRLSELAGRLAGSFFIEDSLQRVEHVAAILRRG